MRKVRVLFSGVKDFSTLLIVLERLHKLGEAHCQHFVYRDAGFGSFVLETPHDNQKLENELASLSPAMMTGVEEMGTKEECHGCRDLA